MGTQAKIRLVRGLLETGVPQVEVTSFVSPKWVPQLSDAAEVLAAFDSSDKAKMRVLIPNFKGLERALENGVTNVVFTVGATDSFNRRNVNRTVEASMTELQTLVGAATASGCRVDVALSVAFGCPFDGPVQPQRVVDLCARIVALGASEVSVADTIGVATPASVRNICKRLAGVVPQDRLSLHLHDTRGLGVANVVAAYEAGIDRFDGSAGGLGGCPFAPRSTGNVCSEDALAALLALGAIIGADLSRYCAVSRQLATDLGHDLPGKLYRAGLWPGSN